MSQGESPLIQSKRVSHSMPGLLLANHLSYSMASSRSPLCKHGLVCVVLRKIPTMNSTFNSTIEQALDHHRGVTRYKVFHLMPERHGSSKICTVHAKMHCQSIAPSNI